MTGHTDASSEVVAKGVEGLARYADAVGVLFHSVVGEAFAFSKDEVPWAPYYARYPLIARGLADYAYVLWLDADIIPLGLSHPQEVFGLAMLASQPSLWIAPDLNDLVNSGVMLWHRSGLDLLSEICDRAFEGKDYLVERKHKGAMMQCPDQGVIKAMLTENFADMLPRTRFLPAWKINAMPQYAYWGAPIDPRYAERGATAFLHLAGVPDVARLEILKRFERGL